MDAPQGRYRVVEKHGRLIVIDNGTGQPIPSSVAPPPGGRRRSAGQPVAAADPGPIDRAVDFLVACVVKQWDCEGRAVIAWEWRESGKVRRWDALLDEGQQRRLGRALLVLAAAPVLLVAATIFEGALFGLALILAAPPLLWAWLSLRRLYRETNAWDGRG
jgi:hypothetical protein